MKRIRLLSKANEEHLDASVDKVVNLAMELTNLTKPMDAKAKDIFRYRMQNTVDELVDACRFVYQQRKP